jgi:transposase
MICCMKATHYIRRVSMNCPKCQSEKSVKSGIVHKKQRYKCKDCGCHFTQPHPRGRPEKDKLLAVFLHLNGMSMNAIGKMMKVSAQSVMRWILAHAATIKDPQIPENPVFVEIDEMHHFLLKKTKKFGSGKCWMLSQPTSWGGFVVVAIPRHD